MPGAKPARAAAAACRTPVSSGNEPTNDTLDDLEDLDAMAHEQATACEEVDVSRTP